ncbi:MAG: transcriptional regulator with GAF, ATPase, and Fis domain [Arenicella sp.]|jgi:transcriptional regulator with GAF, ATPase, and Fis domain
MQNKPSTFNSIGGKLRFSFSITTLIILLLTLAFFWFDNKDSELRDVSEQLNQISLKMEQAGNVEKDFFLEESINLDFYETGKSELLERHKNLLKEVSHDLELFKYRDELKVIEIDKEVENVTLKLEKFETVFDSLVGLILQRGFKNCGLEGDMRRAIGRVTNSGYKIDLAKILSVRRREKDYLLRKDDVYVNMLLENVLELEDYAKKNVMNEVGRASVLDATNNYQRLFLEYVEKDKLIGIKKGQGLKSELDKLSKSIEFDLKQIQYRANSRASGLRKNIEIAIIAIFVMFIILNFLLSHFTTKSLRVPLEGISNDIHKVVSSNFQELPISDYSHRKDEIGRLSEDFREVVDKIQVYTADLQNEKEKVSHAYEDIQTLSKLGQSITAELKVNNIIDLVQQNLQKLMKVSTFWIGIYDEQNQEIKYKGGLLGQRKATSFRQSTEENDKIGVWCFKNQQAIIINHLDAETEKYSQFSSATGEQSQGIVYLPLTTKDKQIGVLSVQHEEPNYFTENKVDLIKNLATYTVVALDNALIYRDQDRLIKKRTSKVLEQKEEIESQKEKIQRAFEDIQLISEIGKSLTSTLSLSDIIRQVYFHLNRLMNVAIFGIGLHDVEKNKLVFKSSIENGKELEAYTYNLDDAEAFAVRCFNNREEIFINNLKEDLGKYGMQFQKNLRTEDGTAQSIIYLPLQTKNRVLGVIGVQSMAKEAYTTNHLQLLRNISIYTVIAIQNAQSYQKTEEQRILVEQNAHKVMASINYAKRIQEAFLPEMASIQKSLPQSFVLFKPRDIVSGDFYWFNELNGKTYLSVLDCTGHGVPGAFMSMIGNELLNEAVNRIGLQKPHEILSHMHTGIRKDLRQYETGNQDGMDMTLCVIDKENNLLEFAGANNPLVYIQNEEMMVIRGDKYSIGGEQREVQRVYTTHSIDISTPTTFYLYTDGYQDQFGGKDGRKFMSQKFRKLLHTVCEQPMAEQKVILEKTLNKWMIHNKQIDDVLVVGVTV